MGSLFGVPVSSHTVSSTLHWSTIRLVFTHINTVWGVPRHSERWRHEGSRKIHVYTLRRVHNFFLGLVFLYLQSMCASFTSPPPSARTFSVSSFLTDWRFAQRSMDTLCCMGPSGERRMASADTRTRRRLGLLNFPLRSRTLMCRSLIWSSVRKHWVMFLVRAAGVSHEAAFPVWLKVSRNNSVLPPLVCSAWLWLQCHIALHPPHLSWSGVLYRDPKHKYAGKNHNDYFLWNDVWSNVFVKVMNQIF